MTLFRSLVSLVLVLSFVGCVKADKQQKGAGAEGELKTFSRDESLIPYNNKALFEAGQIELEDIKFSIKDQDKVFKQFDSVQLFLKVCSIRDRASQGTIRNESFHVSSELGEQVVSDKNGGKVSQENIASQISNPIIVNSNNCLRWTQRIERFNFLAPSVNIVLHYKLQAVSGRFGQIVKRIMFNPWDMYRRDSKTGGFFDLTGFSRSDWHTGVTVFGEDDVVAALKGQFHFPNEKKLRLEIDSLNLMPSPEDAQVIEDYNTAYANLPEDEREAHKRARQAQLAGTDFKMKMAFRGQPFITYYDSTGKDHRLDLTTGRFRVHMSLIVTGNDPGSGERYKIATMVNGEEKNRIYNQTWEADRKGLMGSLPMFLRAKAEYGQVKLAVRVAPNDIDGVEPFEAVYDLGNYDSWMRRSSPMFADNYSVSLDEANYEEYVNGAKEIIVNPCREIKTQTEYDSCLARVKEDNKEVFDFLSATRKQDSFYFGTLNLRFMRIQSGETATDRTLMYAVKSCVEDGFYGTSVGRGLQFEVVTYDEGKPHRLVRRTNEEGCLTWFGFTSHKYYRKEVLFKKNAQIKFIGNHTGKDRYNSIVNPYDHTFTYFMNPWDEKWTFGWDERDMPENYPQLIRDEREKMPESKLFIADFKYQTMGFRYSIDKFLNLKVKKSVLLNIYPYVLKYNSIIYGRRGTEKLRDGIYLMKVALQKDYLDPAAKGVRIFDCKKSEVVDLAKDFGQGVYIREDYQGPMEELRLSDLESLNTEKTPEEIGGEVCAGADIGQSINADYKYDENFTLSSDNLDRLMSEEELGRTKKRYITYQQKLVRVQGGMIITPVEFEVDDLRLMRIRNQFFVQLQTIDERKLRLAAYLNDKMDSTLSGFDLQAAYKEIYDQVGEVEKIDREAFLEAVDKFVETKDLAKTYREFERLGINTTNAEQMLMEVFGVESVPEEKELYQTKLNQIRTKIIRMLEYKAEGLDYVSAYRNDKFDLLGEILDEAQNLAADRMDKQLKRAQDLRSRMERGEVISEEEREKVGNSLKDPLLMDFLAGGDGISNDSLILEIIDRRMENADDETKELLESLKSADFTKTSLAANYDLNKLLNDGIHEPPKGTEKVGNVKLEALTPEEREKELYGGLDQDEYERLNDDGKSGLPARTFVGPLTFVFNTNGSSLRPTDNLGEANCRSAFCEMPAKIRQSISESNFRKAVQIDESGNMTNSVGTAIYDLGENINADYEENPFYGYLGEYKDMMVDDLIREKQKIDKDEERKMFLGSQIFNFTRSMRLKHVLLNDDKDSRLKRINYEDCEGKSIQEMKEECLIDVTQGPEIIQKGRFFDELNNRAKKNPEIKISVYDETNSSIVSGPEAYYKLSEREFQDQDVESIILNGSDDLIKQVMPDRTMNAGLLKQRLESDSFLRDEFVKRREFHQRMCFVLTQNFFKEKYFKKRETKNPMRDTRKDALLLEEMELSCQRYVARMYGYDSVIKGASIDSARKTLNETVEYDIPRPTMVNFSPIVFERKARVYETTGQYEYKGGKSLNINLTTSFGISSSHGMKINTSASWKPYDATLSAAAQSAMVGVGVYTAIKTGALAGGSAGGPIGAGVGALGAAALVGLYKVGVSAFGWSKSYGMDEATGKTQGTSVTSGTFLVSQQAKLNILLGSHERCMIARFHPVFIQNFFNSTKYLNSNYQAPADIYAEDWQDESDIESIGVMICTGKKEDRCLPITEKYYYFTQHFTEGDMLDTADLHNHPWLLQLRGERDFKTFTATIGARQVETVDRTDIGLATWQRMWNDSWSFNFSASDKDAIQKEFTVVSKEDDINWPLEELSRVYFNVLPTFPGLYTFYDYEKPEWPYEKIQTGLSCELPQQEEK